MPYNASDLVDYSAQKEIEKLETAFNDLADILADRQIEKEQERIGAIFSFAGAQ